MRCRKSLVIFLVLVVCMFICIGCGNTKESSNKENTTLKDSVAWEDSSKKIEDFKKLSVSGYPDKPIGDTVAGQFSVNRWQYGREEKEEYLLCSYVHEDEEYTLIFYKDTYENVNIAEYYIEQQPQDRETIKKITKEIFGDKEPSSEQTEETEDETSPQKSFILSDSQKYKADDSNVEAVLNISVTNDSQIQVDMNISNHTYDVTYSGEILSPETAQITLDAGEKINFVWENENKLKVSPVNGFTDESISMMRLMCECLNGVTYVSEDASTVNQSFSAQYMPADGHYYNSTNGGFPHTCEIRVNRIDDRSFSFSIWDDEKCDGNPKMIFKEHTAEFDSADATTAVFYGQQYTLYFDCSSYGIITLSGFDAATGLGNTFYNMAITNN